MKNASVAAGTLWPEAEAVKARGIEALIDSSTH
jgi:hypothetical protein